VTKLIIIF